MSERITAIATVVLAVSAAWFAFKPDSDAYTPKTDVSQVVVARADLAQGTTLTEGMLETMTIPRRYMQAASYEVRTMSDIKNPVGRVTAVRIPKGDQITENCLKGGEKALPARTVDNKELSQMRYTEGLRYFQAANYDKAREEWNESLKLDPKNPDATAGLDRIKKITSK